jgi:spoIIIJ-associated protein
MKTAEGRGRTVDEAVDDALGQLGTSRRQVDVMVVSETPDEAVVKVTVLEDRPQAAPIAGSIATGPAQSVKAEQVRKLLSEVLDRMGIKCQVNARETPEAVIADVSGRDLGMLIGWRGETLRALQTIINLLSSRFLGPEGRVVVDVEKYRQRRENTVREIAQRAARQVKMTGDPITLDAMQPFERRAVHLALANDPDVKTGSIGDEPERRVVVAPQSGEA